MERRLFFIASLFPPHLSSPRCLEPPRHEVGVVHKKNTQSLPPVQQQQLEYGYRSGLPLIRFVVHRALRWRPPSYLAGRCGQFTAVARSPTRRGGHVLVAGVVEGAERSSHRLAPGIEQIEVERHHLIRDWSYLGIFFHQILVGGKVVPCRVGGKGEETLLFKRLRTTSCVYGCIYLALAGRPRPSRSCSVIFCGDKTEDKSVRDNNSRYSHACLVRQCCITSSPDE